MLGLRSRRELVHVYDLPECNDPAVLSGLWRVANSLRHGRSYGFRTSVDGRE